MTCRGFTAQDENAMPHAGEKRFALAGRLCVAEVFMKRDDNVWEWDRSGDPPTP
jgi:hypothetical protein